MSALFDKWRPTLAVLGARYRYRYLSFEGRIDREPFWMGTFFLLAVLNSVQQLAAIAPMLQFNATLYSMMQAAGKPPDPGPVLQYSLDFSRHFAWIALLVWLLVCYPAAAVGIKRRHDRNRSGVDVVVYLAWIGLLTLGYALGYGFKTIDFYGSRVPFPDTIGFASVGVLWALQIYLLIVAGCMPGTKGPNKYGPDPSADRLKR